MDKLETDTVTLIKKAKTDLKQIPPPVTPPPTPTPVPPPATNVLLEDNFDTPYAFPIGTTSPNSKWVCKYVGSGKVASENGVMHLVPKTATQGTSVDSSGVGYETYACEVQSKNWYKDFQLDVDMKTNKQLRTGKNSVGGTGPATWEVAWLFFRYTNEQPKSNHHYYFMLRPGKSPEFGKKDNAPGDTRVEQQIYLPITSSTPQLKVGTANHVTVVAKGTRITITVDGIKCVDYTDKPNDPAKMSQGLICLYCEDSDTSWDNVKVVGI